MSDNNFTDLSDEEKELGSAIFSMINLKYFFFAMLILSFLVMSFSKGTNNRRIRLLNRRRKVVPVWDNEKRNKIKALSKKSVDIKDFKGYKPSDVENITALNTLINSYISKMYEEIKPCLTLNNPISSSKAANYVSGTNLEERKGSLKHPENFGLEDDKNCDRSGSPPEATTGKGVALPPVSTNKNSEGSQNSGEMEQGSERNSSEGDSRDSLVKDTPGIVRKRSILKAQKNVVFNLGQNKVKII